MNKLVVILLAAVLVGCGSTPPPPTVVPVVEKPKISDLLAKPPADAMIEPKEPILMKKGDTTSGNTSVMRQNNLEAMRARESLKVLQKYINNIFSEKK